jgi:hypothetical protein
MWDKNKDNEGDMQQQQDRDDDNGRTRDNDERHVLQSAVYVFDIVNVLIIEIFDC